MKKILINYACLNFFKNQKLNSKSGLEVGGFDEVCSYGFDDIDVSFKKRNWHILGQIRGVGYWIWKPYFLLKTLKDCSVGDVVVYCDSGVAFIDSVDPLVDIAIENDIVPFYIVDPDGPNFESPNDSRGKILWERQQTKRDIFYFLDCDDMSLERNQKIHESRPRIGSIQVYKKSEKTMQFINDYLRYCEDYRMITDSPNCCELPDYPEICDYRHDQSIFSVLTKMLDIPAYRDPCRPISTQTPDTGKLYYNEIDCDLLYGQITDHHRNSE